MIKTGVRGKSGPAWRRGGRGRNLRLTMSPVLRSDGSSDGGCPTGSVRRTGTQRERVQAGQCGWRRNNCRRGWGDALQTLLGVRRGRRLAQMKPRWQQMAAHGRPRLGVRGCVFAGMQAFAGYFSLRTSQRHWACHAPHGDGLSAENQRNFLYSTQQLILASLSNRFNRDHLLPSQDLLSSTLDLVMINLIPPNHSLAALLSQGQPGLLRSVTYRHRASADSSTPMLPSPPPESAANRATVDRVLLCCLSLVHNECVCHVSSAPSSTLLHSTTSLRCLFLAQVSFVFHLAASGGLVCLHAQPRQSLFLLLLWNVCSRRRGSWAQALMCALHTTA